MLAVEVALAAGRGGRQVGAVASGGLPAHSLAG